jgi:hypothetical protein
MTQGSIIRLPVAKFSFSTDLKSTPGGFAWKHVHHVDLVLDSFRTDGRPSSSRPNRSLKVVKGTETLVCFNCLSMLFETLSDMCDVGSL